MNIVQMISNPNFLLAVLASISAAAMVFTFGSQITDRSEMRDRIKRVALERDRLRAEEMARLRKVKDVETKSSIRSGKDTKTYMNTVVDRFSLRKAFVDDNTDEMLQRGGYRGAGHMTRYLFFRLLTPIVMFILAMPYLSLVAKPENPLYLNVLYALAIGLAGAYLPVLVLKNKISKRQSSIRRAWPDCLDLLLLCVESGMSIEHAFKRVSGEMGDQSVDLTEELTLTTAELSFLENRGQAFENLGKRTGLDGVRAVMMALIQAEKYGTSIGQSLRVMAEEEREQRMMAAEKKAAALPPKLTVPLIVFFLPVLFIVIMAPAAIKIFGPGGTFGS